jgi:putative hydrolase of the HAD superfamily
MCVEIRSRRNGMPVNLAPQCILFDAVGTLLHAEPRVADAYHQIGTRHGSLLTRDEVQRRFVRAFAATRQDDGIASAERERQRWARVVGEVFRELPLSHETLLDALWTHFAQPTAWRLFDDAAPTIEELRARGWRLGIASNFDERLVGVCQGHAALAGLELFWSSDIGYSKPHPQFFTRVAKRLGLAPREILLVGDDFAADLQGARAAGWQAIHLNRDGRAQATDDSACSLRELTIRLQ